MHPNTTAHNPVWTSVWYTNAHEQILYAHMYMLTAALKIKTNQCFMLQILGVRKEGSGRIERRERESYRNTEEREG